jgi:hypothetical protein
MTIWMTNFGLTSTPTIEFHRMPIPAASVHWIADDGPNLNPPKSSLLIGSSTDMIADAYLSSRLEP